MPSVDVVLVVREELPDGHPGRAEYQHLLVERGEEWVSSAIGALAAAGVSANSTVLVGESFAESLIDFAEQKNSDLIVIGGARDGIFGGHVIGSVTGALLHRSPIPVALAPRGYAEDPPGDHHRGHGRCAHPAGPGQSAAVRDHARQRRATSIRTVSLVSSENLAEAGDVKELRSLQVAAARENCAVAARALPDAPEIECLVADGLTLESALKKLNWDDTDVLVVGSSRFAAPRRIFLGSTAARILAGVDAPVIVIPREGAEA